MDFQKVCLGKLLKLQPISDSKFAVVAEERPAIFILRLRRDSKERLG
jgi:hypothetical protein